MIKEVYVYYDMDHNDCQVFDSMKKAKIYAEEHWEIIEWTEDANGASDNEYVRIYKRKIN